MSRVIEFPKAAHTGVNNQAPPPQRVTDKLFRTPVVVYEALPLGTAVAIPGIPAQCQVARRWVHTHAGRPLSESETLILLTSELFSNAIRHSLSGEPGGWVVVVVSKAVRTVQIKVIDQGPRTPGSAPCIREAEGHSAGGVEETGFGLQLLSTMATRWGTVREPTNTAVWFDLERAGA